MSNTKCVNCCEGTMIENKEYGERLIEAEALEVIHDFWKDLDKKSKKNKVKKELIRQGYLRD